MLGGTLYTLKELSELFGVHRTTVMRTIERNRKVLSSHIRKGLRPMRISRAGAEELARIMGFDPDEALDERNLGDCAEIDGESEDFVPETRISPPGTREQQATFEKQAGFLGAPDLSEFQAVRSGQRVLRPLVSARLQKGPGVDHHTAVRNGLAPEATAPPPIRRTNAAFWQTSGTSALAPMENPFIPIQAAVLHREEVSQTLPEKALNLNPPEEVAPIPSADAVLAPETGEPGLLARIAAGLRRFWLGVSFRKSHRREELLDYCERYHDSAHLEGMAGSLFNKLLVKCSDDNIFAYSIERKILPKYIEFMEIMGQQKVVTEDLAETHRIARNMMELQYQGFTVMIDALREGSGELYAIASAKIDRANTVRMEFLSSLKTLADKYVD